MKITQEPFSPLAISISVERDAYRSPGIHLSSILKDRLITAGIERQVKGAGQKFTPEEQHLVFERGFLWERMVKEFCEAAEWLRHNIELSASKHFAKAYLETDSMLIRPGECALDGIYMTPDAIDIKNNHVEEWKATAIRAKNFSIESRRLEWLWQAGAYANVFGMTKAIIRVWHVADNVIVPHVIEWDKEEVSENWRQILEHYEIMKAYGRV